MSHGHTPCGICHQWHAPRCLATRVRWPTGPLVDMAGGVNALRRRMGHSDGSIPATISDVQADRWATACGYHPAMVWGWQWVDAALTTFDRQHTGHGSRAAWLHGEPPDQQDHRAAMEAA